MFQDVGVPAKESHRKIQEHFVGLVWKEFKPRNGLCKRAAVSLSYHGQRGLWENPEQVVMCSKCTRHKSNMISSEEDAWDGLRYIISNKLPPNLNKRSFARRRFKSDVGLGPGVSANSTLAATSPLPTTLPFSRLPTPFTRQQRCKTAETFTSVQDHH